MKSIKILSRSIPTTDFGLLQKGETYSVNEALATFLIKRNMAEAVAAKSKKKSTAKKA